MSIANQSVEALDVSGVDEAKNKRIEWNEKTRLLIPSSLIGNADLWVHEFNEMSIFEVLPENLRFGGVMTTLRGVRQKTRITHILVAFHSVSCFRGEILLPEKFAKEIVFEKRWRARARPRSLSYATTFAQFEIK